MTGGGGGRWQRGERREGGRKEGGREEKEKKNRIYGIFPASSQRS